MVVPSRRMLIVFSILIGSMTLTSGLLLLLLPGPVAPFSGLQLQRSIDTPIKPQDMLFGATTEADRWTAIAIHFSGDSYGSARTLNELHERQGFGGLAFHFVISNGRGAPDGQIDIGFRWRWRGQISEADGWRSAWSTAPDDEVHICLIGDGSRETPTEAQIRELVWLVRQLQNRFHISARRVRLVGDELALFPVASFRQQLLRR